MQKVSCSLSITVFRFLSSWLTLKARVKVTKSYIFRLNISKMVTDGANIYASSSSHYKAVENKSEIHNWNWISSALTIWLNICSRTFVNLYLYAKKMTFLGNCINAVLYNTIQLLSSSEYRVYSQNVYKKNCVTGYCNICGINTQLSHLLRVNWQLIFWEQKATYYTEALAVAFGYMNKQ